jgi:hypothetical protein
MAAGGCPLESFADSSRMPGSQTQCRVWYRSCGIEVRSTNERAARPRSDMVAIRELINRPSIFEEIKRISPSDTEFKL